MATVTIGIGNSDNRLTQGEWADFQRRVQSEIVERRYSIHFAGASHPDVAWQNACWVIETPYSEQYLDNVDFAQDIYDFLSVIARDFRQDSIALTIGNTLLVKPKPHNFPSREAAI
jgi:hypothetical protein